jgi:ketosteroid isomerase-like protein
MIEAAADNERLLREGYAAFAAGDLATIERLFHPRVIWHAQRLGQLGGDHIGWPAVAEFFGQSMQLTRGTFHIDVLELLSNANAAAAVVQSMGERDGKKLNDRQVHLFHIEHGRVVEIWQFVGDGHATENFWA